MRWTPGGRSRNLDDRRGESAGGGLGRGIPLGIGGLVLLGVLSLATGRNFFALLDMVSAPSRGSPSGSSAPVQSSPEEERLVEFVSSVLDDVQSTWSSLLPGRYQDSRLVLFRNAIDSACGFAQSATGPFYCPADHKVYIDLSFYEELHDRFGAPGDFAQAYVLAHEIGHHVQALTGTDARVRSLQQGDPSRANALSVRMELQADCYAGVWGHSAASRGKLEGGDVEEGLNAAAAIGDDRLQRETTGRVQPDAFTHGTSAQRVQWFRRGLDTGQPDACDTFGGSD